MQSTLQQLTHSVQAYQTFAEQLTHKDAKGHVQTAFNEFFADLKKKGAKIKEHHASPSTTTVQEKWAAYQQIENPNSDTIRQMLRIGLSTLGLEDNPEFLAFVGRQQPHPMVYRWVKTYVWRFLILQLKEPHPATAQWVEQLLRLETQLGYDTLQLQQYQKAVANTQHASYIQRLIDAAYQTLQKEDAPPELVEETLCAWFQAMLPKVIFYPQDAIIAQCFAGYFDFCLQQYVSQYRGDEHRLTALLTAFATLHTDEGRGRFHQLFTTLKSTTIHPTEQEAIKAHCSHQIGDPRLTPAAWIPLKQAYPKMFRLIQYWFNEADFELFFEFVFPPDKPDKHGRKACWQRYLPYAEDFKIFLPEHELRRFNDLKTNGQLKTDLEPWLNLSKLTSFVIKTNKVLIFETQDEGNSAYIYDLTALTDETLAEQTILAFVETVFNKTTTLVKQLNIKSSLARKGLHPDLAPDGKGYYHFPSEVRHYRFTHDPEGKWHESVRQMMRQIHGLSPR